MINQIMMITKPVSKVEECFKQYFLFARIKSIQSPFSLKHVVELILLFEFKDCINDTNKGLFGPILKSPKIIWLS